MKHFAWVTLGLCLLSSPVLGWDEDNGRSLPVEDTSPDFAPPRNSSDVDTPPTRPASDKPSSGVRAPGLQPLGSESAGKPSARRQALDESKAGVSPNADPARQNNRAVSGIESDAVPAKRDQGEWKPKLLVTLNTTEDGKPRSIERQVQVPVSVTSFEEHIARNSAGRQVTARVPVTREVMQVSTVRTTHPGVALIACDDIQIGISTGDDGEQVYELHCDGRAQVNIACLKIDCPVDAIQQWCHDRNGSEDAAGGQHDFFREDGRHAEGFWCQHKKV